MPLINTGDQIRHSELREDLLPRQGAQWTKIVPFASAFNPHAQLEGSKVVAFASLDYGNLGAYTLTDLRAALFFEYRRYNHFAYDPDADAMRYLHALVEEIRLRIQREEHLRAEEA